MLPVAVANPFAPIQASLVSTAMADSFALRVPADNVPPSVSIPPFDNNARGNSAPASGAAGGAVIVAAPPTLASGLFLINSGSGFWSSPQATFLAQVISQDASPQARSVLVQYEKLMNMGNVKYKPSNATLPPPEPAGVFGRLVQQEQAARVAQEYAPPPAAIAEKAAALAANENVPAPRPVSTQRLGKVKNTGTTTATVTTTPARAALAYQVTAAFSLAPPTSQAPVESIEETNATA